MITFEMAMRSVALGCLSVLFAASTARATVRPYVTLHDDGTLLALTDSSAGIAKAFMKIYDASGTPRPSVISVWSDFDLGGESYGTFFIPLGNSVQGIGFDRIYGGSGLLTSAYGPLNALLLHNNVLQLSQRVTENRATSDIASYAQYLFLLEFSHQWLAAARVPGTSPNQLGIWPHWSFWYSSGDSPPGGNVWDDNGDGTFSTVPLDPGQVKYSNFDLYLMGLVDAGAVGSIQVIQDAGAPANPTDPSYGGPYAAHSLTDFDAAPLTVTGVAKTYSIADIISANGERKPATAPNTLTVGYVLLVSQDAGPAQIAADQAFFDPISVTLAPAFTRATGGIASLIVLTDGGELPDDGGVMSGDAGEPDAGAQDRTDAGTPDAGLVSAGSKGGCSSGTGGAGCLLAVALFAFVTKRRSARPGRFTSPPDGD